MICCWRLRGEDRVLCPFAAGLVSLLLPHYYTGRAGVGTVDGVVWAVGG